MALIDNGKQESKKEKNTKHGAIAISAIVITILSIIIGAYLFTNHRAVDTKPTTNNTTYSTSNE